MFKCKKLSAKGRNPRSIQSIGALLGFRRNQFDKGTMVAKTIAKLTHFTDYVLM